MSIECGATVQSVRERESAIMAARSFVSTINERFPEAYKRRAGSCVSYSLTGGYLVSEIHEYPNTNNPHDDIQISPKLIHVYRGLDIAVTATGYALDGIHYRKGE